MKNYLKYSVFLLTGFVVLFTSCKKEVGPDHLPNLPVLARSPIPLFTPDTAFDVVIQEPAEFHAAFSIAVYFPNDAQPVSCDIDVAMDGVYTNIKTLKTGITTFPSKVDVTGDDLAKLFGIDVNTIVPGDQFELRATFTLKDGTVLHGFANDIYAADASSDVKNFPGSKTTITYTAVCPLDIDAFLGAATVEDAYFLEGTYPVTVTLSSPGVLKVTGINQDPNSSVLVSLNSKTFVATVPSQLVAANTPPSVGPYHNLNMEGSGLVDACSISINLSIDWSVDEGDFGAGPFIIKK